MKKIYKLLLACASLGFGLAEGKAQCISPAAFGSGTANSAGSVTLTTCAFGGEYSTVTVTLATNYVFSATGGAGNYITITNTNNVVVAGAFGNSPLTVAIPSVGVYRMHLSVNAACGTDGVCHTNVVSNLPGACSGNPPASNALASSTLVCPGANVNLSLSTVYTGSTGIAYQWYSSTTGAGGPYNAIASGTNATLAQTAGSSTTFYQAVITCTNGPASTTSTPVQVAIGINTVNAIATPTLICPNANVNLSLSSTFPGVSYQWQAATTASVGPYTAIPNGTTAAFTATGTSANTWFQSVLSCSAAPSVSVASNPRLVSIGINTVNALATPTLICPNTNINLSLSSSFPGVSYQWQAATSASVGPYTSISNGTTAAFTATGTSVNTWFQAVLSCTAAPSVSITTNIPRLVTVGLNTVNAIASSATICSGSNVNLSLSSSFTGVSYNWQASTTGSVSGYASLPSGTTAAYTASNNTASTWFQSVISCTSAPSVSVASNPAFVTITTPPTVTATASGSLYCSPAAGLTLTATGTATSFAWSPNNGLSSTTGSNVVATPSASVVYTLTGVNPGCNGTTTIAINAGSAPLIHSVSATPGVVCSGSNSQLQVLGYAGAPVNTYSFAPSTGSSLIPAAGGVTLVPTNVDDTPAAASNIGFTFNFNGINYTQFVASPDGWIRFGGGAGSNQFSNSVISTINTPKLYPYWDDVATGTTGYVKSVLLGTAPTRTLVVEWFVTIPRNTTGPANSTFQALLHEVNGVVEFRYGTLGSALMSASSGLTGNATNFSSVTFTSATTSTTTPTDNNAGQPASGVAYKFTPPTIISWTPGTFLSSTSVAAPSVTAINATTNYTATLTGVTGCSNSGATTVSVNPLPVVTVNSGTICSGNSFTMSPSGATTYTYSNGPVVTPMSNSNYTVTGTDNNGCVSVPVVSTVSVNATPTLVVSATNGTICAGASTPLNASGATTYTWNTTSTSSVIAVSPSVTTSYSVTGENNGCFDTDSVIVTVNALPSVSLTAAQSLVCVNSNTVALNGSPSGGVYTGSNVAGQAFTPGANAGTFTPVYSVTNGTTGCSNSASVSIIVDPCTNLNKVTPLKGISVYPNPNSGSFTIELNNGAVKNVHITDLTGRVVVETSTSNDTLSVDLTTMANGVYFVKIQSNNSVEIVKVVKQ